MKRFLIIALVLILSISLFGCVSNRNENTDESDKAVVAKLV
jgi:hypothetical protein